MAEQKKKATNEDVLAALAAQTDAITKLAEALTPKKVEEKKVEAPPEVKATGMPIPYEYREIVNTLLNKDFGIDIAYLPDTNSFSFDILVPRKYTNAGEAHWATYKEDRRSKVIPNALGANGVREWVTKVYNNFGDEIKSAITFDRAQL